MMDCLEHRRITGADPTRTDAELLAHRAQCQACATFHERQLALDEKLRAALAAPLPAADGSPYQSSDVATANADGPGSDGQYAWIGVAASVVLGLGLAITAWYSGPKGSIGEDLVAHVIHEEASLVSTSEAVPVRTINAVLRQSGASLSGDQNLVTYARTCMFRGSRVPHLIVDGENGPVTVMILPDVDVDQPSSFSESGYYGTLLPSASGSIAVIAGETADIEPVAVAIIDALRWEI